MLFLDLARGQRSLKEKKIQNKGQFSRVETGQTAAQLVTNGGIEMNMNET